MTHETATPGPVLLHVGYIKTATTFLQNQVFSQDGSGMELAAGRQTRAQLVEHILLADDYVFDAIATRAALEQRAAPVRDRGHLPVWSEEMLLGNPPARRYDGAANAARLHAIYPQAKVLITIRNQVAMAASIYGEYIRGGGALGVKAFFGTGTEPASYRPVLDPDFLKFDRAIARYHTLFGAENVLVLPQEQLQSDPASYMAALSAFTGCALTPPGKTARAHTREGAFAQGLRRWSNRVILRDPTAPRRQGAGALQDRIIRKVDRLAPQSWGAGGQSRRMAWIEHRYRDAFGDSNRRSAELIGCDLAAFGYPTQ